MYVCVHIHSIIYLLLRLEPMSGAGPRLVGVARVMGTACLKRDNPPSIQRWLLSLQSVCIGRKQHRKEQATVSVVGIPVAVAFLGGCRGRDQAAHGLRGADVRLLPGAVDKLALSCVWGFFELGTALCGFEVVLLLGCLNCAAM